MSYIIAIYIIILYYEHIVVTCALVHLFNGQANTMATLVHGRYPFGTRISFSCSTGYSLDTTGSNSSITCLTTGVWSHTTPRCNIGNGTILCPFTRSMQVTSNCIKGHNILHFNSQNIKLFKIKKLFCSNLPTSPFAKWFHKLQQIT